MSEKKDHEYSMARAQLATVMSAAKRLRSKMKGEGELEAWVQSKITKAADYLDSAADYVDSGEMNEAKNGRCPAGQYYCYTNKECRPIPKGFMVDPEGMLRKENGATVDEANKSGDSSLRDWFGKSKSSDGKPGWVQLGGKYAGKPCAKQPGQTTKPKCGSSKMKRALSKDEEERAFRRKNRQDPNPERSGKAINVKTEETQMRSVSEVADFVTLPLQIEIPNNIRDFNLGLMFRESLDQNSGMLFIFDEVAEQSFYMKETKIPLDIAFIREDGTIESIKQLEPFDETPVSSEGEVLCALEVNRGWFAENNVEVGDEIDIEEAAGEKDACYHKVKSRYKVWPSAYASGALVKCRKKGADNWGNSTKKEEVELDEKCWKGYEKKGMKTMFGKRYPNCVKKEEAECVHTKKGKECPVHGMDACPDEVNEAVRLPAKTGSLINVIFRFRSSSLMLRMFFPQTSLPTRSDVQDQINKVYPGAKVLTFNVSDYEPGQPILHAEGAAWTRKEGQKKSGGLNEKGRKSYERENPGSDLKAPSKKVGNPRRASFCARMKGMKKKLTSSKTASDPNSRINKSLRAWNC